MADEADQVSQSSEPITVRVDVIDDQSSQYVRVKITQAHPSGRYGTTITLDLDQLDALVLTLADISRRARAAQVALGGGLP